MAAVELAVDNERLPDYEIMKPFIGGCELGRRSDPFVDHITVVTLDMEEAPDQAATMEIMMERVLGQGTRVATATYYDSAGAKLATIERPPDSGWIHQL
ncbi:hypothetical protein OG601_47425 [Streptomyces sp. NBC_01239]|uniref:hypothetical protein n=1 Tax=Streptomyces sp. NBC_01239 TaxID=2903792 RepID=UPI0022555944|nr:hypothetical protein [Streptomyces sp. NBC_01239]MCX4816759.1 hypothetical protein [Streptomyces sp. NBC_01239]MCX4818207.1 hypothetical protein [Streptomyces sp. NBC_01239]